MYSPPPPDCEGFWAGILKRKTQLEVLLGVVGRVGGW